MSQWFDGYAQRRRPLARWKAPLILSGAAVHVALFTGMWVKGLWELKKVDAAEDGVALSLPPPPPAVDRAPAAAPKPATPRVSRKRVVATPHQPAPPPEPPAIEPGQGDPTAPVGTGDPDAVVGVITDGVPTVLPALLPPEPPKPPTAQPRPKTVASTALEQQRIAGEPRILPDDATAQQIARDHAAEVRGVVKLCLSADGDVRSASMLRSTSFPAYDAKLEREMRTWRYRPYRVDGVATPVCTVITVIYRQR
ncbi:MAG: energy transducer TonB [Kofleriaceae bacterium]